MNFDGWQRPATLAILVAILIQLILAAVITSPWTTGDTEVYRGLAEGLVHGSYGLANQGFAPDVLRPPGYPLALAVLTGWLGLPDIAVVAIQLGLYAASLGLLIRLAPSAGIQPIAVGVIAAVYPFAAIYSSMLGVEAMLVIILTAIAFILCCEKTSNWQLALAGVMAGAAILLRSDMMLLPVVGAGLIVVLPFTWDGWRQRVGQAAIMIVASVAVVAPYAIWNFSQFGRLQPSPLAAAVGSSLYTASWQEVATHEDFSAIYRGEKSEHSVAIGLVAEIERLNATIGAPPMTAPFNPAAYPTREMQVEANKVFGRAALERIRQHPRIYGKHLLANCWNLWNSAEYPASLPEIGKLGMKLISGAVTLFGIAGIILALANFLQAPMLARAAVLAIYPFVVHLPLHTEARYTAAARPLLMFFAAFALSAIVRQWKRRAQ